MKHAIFPWYLYHTGLLLSLLLQTLWIGEVGTAQAQVRSQVGSFDPSKIKHIIFIMQENRTFDSYFGRFPGLGKYGLPIGTSGKPYGMACMVTMSPCPSTSQVRVPIGDLPDQVTNFNHSWSTAQIDYDMGQMDKFNHTSECTAPKYACYVAAQKSLIPNYWKLAQHFVLDDNAFSSVRGPSFPNHLYAVAARSGITPIDSVIDNPTEAGKPEPENWGCNAPSDAKVGIYDNYNIARPMEVTEVSVKTKNGPTCFYDTATKIDTIRTLADEMNSKGIYWKFYTTSTTTSNDFFASFPNVNNESTVAGKSGVDPKSNIDFDYDAVHNQLPAFSWLVAPTEYSEHPPQTTCAGENWVSDRINAVEESPEWSSSVIVLTWDDYGGFYDHMAPLSSDRVDKPGFGYGFRVPFLIISPFAYVKTGNHHISNQPYDFTSILKFAEDEFKLAPLSERDKGAHSIENDLDTSQNIKSVHLSEHCIPILDTTGFLDSSITLQPGDTLTIANDTASRRDITSMNPKVNITINKDERSMPILFATAGKFQLTCKNCSTGSKNLTVDIT